MPVEFLSQERRQHLGRFSDDPSVEQLTRYFHLDDADRALVFRRSRERARLGFALQLGTVRFLGTFLSDPTDVPGVVVDYVARQLDIADRSALKGYGSGETRWDHAAEIRRAYGYHDFLDEPGHGQFRQWLEARAWTMGERRGVLFDLAVAWLLEHKILLPGATVLERFVASIHDQAASRLWRTLASAPTPAAGQALDDLLRVPAGSRHSGFDRLRQGPRAPSAAGVAAALRRLEEVRGLGLGDLDFSGVPHGRLEALARLTANSRAQALERMGEERRLAHLVAFASTLEMSALDDALDGFDVVVGELLGKAARRAQRERLRTLGDLDAAALIMREAFLRLRQAAAESEVDLRRFFFDKLSQAELEAALETVTHLIVSSEDDRNETLLARYGTVRRFLPLLLHDVAFDANQAGAPVLEALAFLRAQETERPRPSWQDAPTAVVAGSWLRILQRDRTRVDHRAYTLCAVERLREALRRRDLFVVASRRWGDPRSQLLSGPEWEAARDEVCRSLRHSPDPGPELAALADKLDAAYRHTAGRLDDNASVSVAETDGKPRLKLSPLDRLDEPASLVELRRAASGLLPKVDLPEVLLEVANWTEFIEEFTHVSEAGSRVEDLATSISAVLIAEACNVGLEPLVRREVPALRRGRLAWVAQNYLRADTLAKANARLVAYHADLPLARLWGGGEVASVDGLRFIVPVPSIHTGRNPKYFGLAGRGVTYLNYVSDQFSGFHAIVVPGTLRDSMFILDGLLEQQTVLDPKEVMADTASYSDWVFGLFFLLGYQFSPRLADLGETRFWRIDPRADYGALDTLARHRINTERIAANWDDLLRVAGSLATGKVKASDFLRTLQGPSRSATLASALAELGRIPKSLYLLEFIDSPTYRRHILVQLNRQEARHRLARRLFHGHRGQLRQGYREGQEDQLGALGLVVNILVLWTTRHLEAALDQLERDGHAAESKDIERLSPLAFRNVNLHGRYSFALPQELAGGELRQLRDDREPDEDEI